MTLSGWLQIVVFAGLVVGLSVPLGGYLAKVFAGERTLLSPLLQPVERLLYRLCGIPAQKEQHWTAYATAMILFNAAGFLALYALQRLQGFLPLNPQGLAAPAPDLAFNTAISFVTNTNWQAYAGETTLSAAVQMAGLTVQNFLSAATGIALSIAVVRGFARKEAATLGNFWVDLTRAVLYVLLPLALLLAVALVWQGTPQNWGAAVHATTLEGAQQTIAEGPAASQVAIKMLGTNGGGFFNANAAHPYENPTPLSNFVQLIAIFLIGCALVHCFGRMVGDPRQGWALLAAMGLLFFASVLACYWAEAAGHPLLPELGIETTVSNNHPGGNMEGKEVRFGSAASALFAVVTTSASCGAVNAMHDSFTPLGGMVLLINMMLGEIIVGGVGAGLCGMLLFAILTVFVAGLMVGRTPEYLGKRIEGREVKMSMLALLCLPLAILGFAAAAAVSPAALASVSNPGPHGFSQLLYAYVSAAANNGSAFAGLNANTPFLNLSLAAAMLIGRFAFVIPLLAVAGALAAKPRIPHSPGSFPTHGGLFIGLLVSIIIIVGGLTFLPALTLGPVAEHLALSAGTLF
jgi:K+-transporting ATPase ATPase A chain